MKGCFENPRKKRKRKRKRKGWLLYYHYFFLVANCNHQKWPDCGCGPEILKRP